MFMKTTSAQLIAMFLIISQIVAAQLPTVRDVFDYDLNDEFHFRLTYNNGPPQLQRSKILGKYFSQNSDTLFYIMQRNDYTSTFIPSPQPHLDYVFYNYIDTVAYTDLDSTIYYYLCKIHLNAYDTSGYRIDTISGFCQMNAFNVGFTRNPFEPDWLSISCINGFGNTRVSFYSSSSGSSSYDFDGYIVYAAKLGFTCGTADTLGLGFQPKKEEPIVSIYPNPVQNELYIDNFTGLETMISIYDMTSKIVLIETLRSNYARLDVSQLSKGFYIVSVQNEKIQKWFKIKVL